MLKVALHAAGYALVVDVGITILVGFCCAIAWIKDMRMYSKMGKED
jgi:hypothetical protein